ncbi:MAG: glutathione S-transferase family protein [Alphaproteobacteria bacterium]|nr:glutathione S-transferase family protein [Alphaproteobacteria bacterium]
MILIGRFGSPFVRRVAITLRLYGIPHEHQALSASGDDRPKLQAINPVARVPALITDEGETLIDSVTILDYLDRLVGPEKALTPSDGAARTKVMALIGLAIGGIEKSIAAYYEMGKRPEEMWHRPWLDTLLEQSKDGFEALDRAAATPWLAGDRMTQADISTVAFWDFAVRVRPSDAPAMDCPNLVAIADRANALPAFAETKP